MRYGDLHPELSSLGEAEFIKSIPSNMIFTLLEEISGAYNSRLSLAFILNSYTQAGLTDQDDERQVHCIWPEHGTTDKNKSARYFKFDRNTGLKDEKVYCYKCDKAKTAFWYLFGISKAYKSHETMTDFMVDLYKVWGACFPREIVLNFDMDSYYSDFDSKSSEVSLMSVYDEVRNRIGPLLNQDVEVFFNAVREFIAS